MLSTASGALTTSGHQIQALRAQRVVAPEHQARRHTELHEGGHRGPGPWDRLPLGTHCPAREPKRAGPGQVCWWEWR